MSLSGRELYEFGPFRLDPPERLLLREGQPVPLPPKAYDLLVTLIARANRLVTKEELLKEVWPGTFVEEANLSYTVSLLRKALGDEGEPHRYIETVPKRGYRFREPIVTYAEAKPSHQKRSPAWWFRRRLALIVAGAALAASALIVTVATRRLAGGSDTAGPVVRFEIPIPASVAPAISPDGTRIVYRVSTDWRAQLYLRPLDTTQSMAVPGTSGAIEPFFSPDGTAVGFYVRPGVDQSPGTPGLMSVNLATGRLTTICCPESTPPRGATWGPNGRIYFAPSLNAGLFAVSERGGTPEAITRLEGKEVGHGWPELLPEGQHLIFTSYSTDSPDDANVEILSLNTGSRRTLLEGGFAARYSRSGHLLYARQQSLMVVPFDARTLQVTGQPRTVVEGVRVNPSVGLPAFSISATGTLVYSLATKSQTELEWIDVPHQTRRELAAPPGLYIDPSLSPDGERLAVAPNYEGHQDIWVHELRRGIWTRLTVNSGFEQAPVWHPVDPDRVVFTSLRQWGPSAELRSVPSDGSREPELLYEGPHPKYATSSSASARLLAFVEVHPDTREDIWLLHFGTKTAAKPLLRTIFRESCPALSPDGRWLAYESNESGRVEIYVRRVDDPKGERWQISDGGGDRPRWTRDGRDIVFRSAKRMVAARVGRGNSFVVEKPRILFEGEFAFGGASTPNYDVSADGGRFLMIKPVQKSSPPASFVVVQNWFTQLAQEVSNR